MTPLQLQRNPDGCLHILCLGCHADDIEIGCGGTILRLRREYPECVVTWVVFSALGDRAAEAQRAAVRFVGPTYLRGPILKTFQDGFMPFAGAEIKAAFEELKQTASPDLIFTHSRADAHQDHRIVADLTWSTFRNHLIFEYEIPKYDGDMGRPSLFVPLSMDTCERKVGLITDTFQSQATKRWFKPETFMSLMRLRGMECNSPSGYAEAFYVRKLVL
jgi:LmbE family N-acetylglucosaminyl deacetylase